MLVLGGTSEIARAAVRALANRGLTKVTLAGRTASSLDAVRTELADLTLDVTTATFEATNVDEHNAFFANVNDDHGPFDAVLVAFGLLGEPFDVDTDPESIRDVADINFTAGIAATLGASQMLAATGGGTVAVVSSTTAIRPRKANLAYGAAKAGFDAFATGLTDALHGTAVRVMIIRPGFVHTRMTEGLEPAPFATTPDVVGSDIADGFADEAVVVYSPSVLRFVAPALGVLPRPIWRLISDR